MCPRLDATRRSDHKTPAGFAWSLGGVAVEADQRRIFGLRQRCPGWGANAPTQQCRRMGDLRISRCGSRGSAAIGS